MIEELNLILIKNFERFQQAESETIASWLTIEQNYQRLQLECEKIWSHYIEDQQYDVERAFEILSKRLSSVVLGDKR